MYRFLLPFCFFIIFHNSIFAQDAIYSLDFIGNWTSTAHPTDYPDPARWSHHLIGATHNSNISFWSIGQIATSGVELFAETGDISIFSNEVNTAITNGNAYNLIDLATTTGQNMTFEGAIKADANFPYVSMMSMIAPSPDWLGEVHNVKLTDAFGNWKSTVSIDVYATDAGTDSGTTYKSANSDTNPKEPMHSLQNTLPFSDQIVATFVFRLDRILGVEDINLKKNISIYPNPSKGIFYISGLNNNILKKVEIFTLTGSKIKVFNNVSHPNSFSIKFLKRGLYFLRLNFEKRSVIKKIFKQ